MSAHNNPVPPGYRDLSMPFERLVLPANLLGVAMMIAPLALFVALHSWSRLVEMPWPLGVAVLVLVGGLFALTVAHEWLHGATWVIAGGLGWSAVSFGMKWNTLTPYAHINAPVTARAYRLGAAMPGLVLGVLPAILALITGSGWIMLLAAAMIGGAVGDLIVLWVIRRVPPGALVVDHPSAVGCFVQEDVVSSP